MIGVPGQYPASSKEVHEKNSLPLEELRKQYDVLNKQLAKHIGTLGEEVVQIGIAEHPVLTRDEAVEYFTELRAAEEKSDKVDARRRTFLFASLGAGAAMASIGSGMSSAIRQLSERMSASSEGRESKLVGFSEKDLPLGLLLGGLASAVVNSKLKMGSGLEQEGAEVRRVIAEYFVRRFDLIRYCLPLLGNDQKKTEDFLDGYFKIISDISVVQKKIDNLSGDKS